MKGGAVKRLPKGEGHREAERANNLKGAVLEGLPARRTIPSTHPSMPLPPLHPQPSLALHNPLLPGLDPDVPRARQPPTPIPPTP